MEIPEKILARFPALRGGPDVVFDRIDPARTAPVVVDLQNGFMEEGARSRRSPRAAGGGRQGGLSARHLRRRRPEPWGNRDAGLLSPEGGPGAEGGLRGGPSPSSALAEARGASGRPGDRQDAVLRLHAGTCALHERLQELGIDTPIVTGTLTNCCSESTARDANRLNHKVIFVTDGNATHTDREHNATLANTCAIFADWQSSERPLRTLEESRPAVAAE